MDSHGSKVSSCEQQRRWSDVGDAQADLSLRWVFMSKGTFSNVAANIYQLDMWKRFGYS